MVASCQKYVEIFVLYVPRVARSGPSAVLALPSIVGAFWLLFGALVGGALEAGVVRLVLALSVVGLLFGTVEPACVRFLLSSAYLVLERSLSVGLVFVCCALVDANQISRALLPFLTLFPPCSVSRF